METIDQSFPWLQESDFQLRQYINQNRIPQALLIIGHKGYGKQQLAEYFSQSLLCMDLLATNIACGKCQSCTLFNAGTHPDYIAIESEEPGKAIGIGVIRQLTTKLALKPQFESHRVVVINPADSLNNASANAFLKYLEEPTERTCLILITNKPSKLPATIRSRCQKLLISTPDQVLVKTWLKQQGISDNTDLLLSLSQGAPLLAKQLAQSSVLKLRVECFNHWMALAVSDENLIAIAEQWYKLEREEINLLLFWLVSWVADMIKLAYDNQAVNIVNLDFVKHLQEIVEQLDLKDMYKYYDLLLLSQQRFDTQLNKQLLFEEILIQWSKLNSR